MTNMETVLTTDSEEPPDAHLTGKIEKRFDKLLKED
jgi:hypothetical protein